MHARVTVELGECFPAELELSADQPVTLGRSRDNAIVVKDDRASRLHAKIYHEDGLWHLRDFSLNGTWVDNSQVQGSTKLKEQALIQIGGVRLRFETLLAKSVQTPKESSLAELETFSEASAESGTSHNSSAPGSQSHSLKKPSSLQAVHYQKQTKVLHSPPPRNIVAANESSLRVDELTALCKFMTQALEMPDAHSLIALALRTILHQTTARIVGYLSFNPDDPMAKMILPETASLDMPLSRQLTTHARNSGQLVWLSSDPSRFQTNESLSGYTDAVCLPLKVHAEAFAALHVYRTGNSFIEREVRFLEAVAGYLAHGLEIHRQRRSLEAENSRLRSRVPATEEIIGSSTPIIHLRQQIVRAASQTLNVLIQGESGSGKELVASALHRNSHRSQGPFVVVNCAAISPTLLEAELFGYKKGAFASADRDYPGLFQQADEGTLFLDEVAELSPDCQAKVLRFIEGKAFRPIGATSDVKVDVRVIASTHRDLESEVVAGRFRKDLYYRLRVISIYVPALREHAEDIPELAQYFLAKISSECRRAYRLTPAAVEKLQAYSWPGNVRQLRAVLESAAVMNDSELLDVDAFPLSGGRVTATATQVDLPASLSMEDVETWAILRALKHTGGNVSHAARLLGLSRDTLHTKLKKKAIDREAFLHTPDPAASI